MKRRMLIGALLVLTLVMVASVAAQTGGGYDLTWSTIDGGGGATSGGAYALNGTFGQPDATTLTGGGYTLTGGFWPGVAARNVLYLPLIVR